MKREDISMALSNISTKHILEAEAYKISGNRKKKYSKPFIIAASFVFLILAYALGMLLSNNKTDTGNMAIKAYAYGTDENITSDGIIINTGTINDNGEMKGHPLMFYLSGENIKSVRFSCQKQKLQFRDWKEKRDEFGLSGNFTVPYGKNKDEYYYLTINWEPDEIIQKLTDNENITIKTLPDELKEDLIVMEIIFLDGKTDVKAIHVSLLDNGNFFAKYGDYNISDTDSFIKRKDAPTLRELSQININEAQNSDAPLNSQPPKNVILKKQKTTPDVKKRTNTAQPANKKPTNKVKSNTKETTNKAKPTAKKTAKNTRSNNKKITKRDKSSAKKTALKYYSKTVFKVITIKVSKYSKNKIIFSVCVSKDGVIQEPNRHITLKQKNGKWKVTGEGY